MVTVRFHNVFGLSAETVDSQPVLGWKAGEDIDDAQVYFFDGYIINIPFIKIMIGDIFDAMDQKDPPISSSPVIEVVSKRSW